MLNPGGSAAEAPGFGRMFLDFVPPALSSGSQRDEAFLCEKLSRGFTTWALGDKPCYFGLVLLMEVVNKGALTWLLWVGLLLWSRVHRLHPKLCPKTLYHDSKTFLQAEAGSWRLFGTPDWTSLFHRLGRTSSWSAAARLNSCPAI